MQGHTDSTVIFTLTFIHAQRFAWPGVHVHTGTHTGIHPLGTHTCKDTHTCTPLCSSNPSTWSVSDSAQCPGQAASITIHQRKIGTTSAWKCLACQTSGEQCLTQPGKAFMGGGTYILPSSGSREGADQQPGSVAGLQDTGRGRAGPQFSQYLHASIPAGKGLPQDQPVC